MSEYRFIIVTLWLYQNKASFFSVQVFHKTRLHFFSVQVFYKTALDDCLWKFLICSVYQLTVVSVRLHKTNCQRIVTSLRYSVRTCFVHLKYKSVGYWYIVVICQSPLTIFIHTGSTTIRDYSGINYSGINYLLQVVVLVVENRATQGTTLSHRQINVYYFHIPFFFEAIFIILRLASSINTL